MRALDSAKFLSRQAVHNLSNRALAAAEKLFPHGRSRVCPCCGWRGVRFRAFAVVEYVRYDAVCPDCGSFERHRALADYYPRFFADLSRRPEGVVHVSPERCLEHVIRPLCKQYERSNFGARGPEDLGLDLTDIALPSESRDVFLLNHVLDCMRDDRRAATEIYRVLKPGGVALGVVGFVNGACTREFAPKSNQAHRIYGSTDVTERFHPFAVGVENAAAGIPREVRKRAAIPSHVWMLVLQKRVPAGGYK